MKLDCRVLEILAFHPDYVSLSVNERPNDDLRIYTDQQPLIFAVSDKNPNAKLKRWKGIIDDHGAKHHNKILDFENGDLVADCAARIVKIGGCKATVDATFCKELQGDTCAQQMVAGVTAQCYTLPGHLSTVTAVDHGTLIINDGQVTIIDLGLKQDISGSYLVTYSSKVSLNGSWYINQLGTSRKKL
ncbi:uncharacterized protein LOC128263896 [Drosophila gunungcola]|uniref:uncharacterized protein LOC128263896 n=1 Tax=Drosophila gunungcola TaxID=103775 RepID=UPI0022DEB453|nr:uncharacterized protein LOC128263896 [Drosophila gunungcola]